MSGGVDSSVAAALLQEQGHEVVGLSAHMWKEGSRCCSLEDVTRARAVCRFLGIEHRTLDAISYFGQMVVDPFVREYAEGRTPSPCVRCNQVIKFGVLLREALAMKCERLATGHYARIEKRADGWHLLRGRDQQKDQSYFLHRLFQEQLGRALFPLGDWTKARAVEYARKRALPVPLNAESQDLCFVPSDGYAAFLEKRRPELKRPGPIEDAGGREIGRHGGFYHFTVGQREGLGVAARERLYVKEVRADTNVVVAGTREEVMSERCAVADTHWILGSPPADGTPCHVKLRYRHKGAAAVIHPLDESKTRVVFEAPQFAVSPGQAAVLYSGDEVLGGGWLMANG